MLTMGGCGTLGSLGQDGYGEPVMKDYWICLSAIS
jgi:hypothetical protein